MANSVNNKRAILPKGEQNELINKILLKISIQEAAKLCNLSERTIRDWRREKSSMDFQLLQRLCQKTNIPIPSNIKLKDRWWYVHLGASIGGKALWEKYRTNGGLEYRTKKWREWWEHKGKFIKRKGLFEKQPIKKPRRSKELAEFAGIMMGDGGITKKQIIVTLHYKDDKDYSEFVITLIKELFNVPVSKLYYEGYSINRIMVSRVELVNFCVKKIELKQGNKLKQKLDIPNWIKQNKQYSIACVRGLVDTDGCIFTHRYKVNGKWYSYKKLTFTSYSKPLRQSVFNILKDNGFNPRMVQDRDVRLDSINDIKTYFKIIGSHNSKHLKRYLK